MLLVYLFLFPLFPAYADTCVTAACHQDIGSLKSPHQPVKDGDCTSCHQRKSGGHPVKGAKNFTLMAGGARLCSQCHDPFGKKKVVHPPVKDGECTACHKPHGTDKRYLLEVGDDQSALCLGCHDNAPFKRKFLHGPAAVGECTKCHDPHEAAEPALLKGAVRDVCLKCHQDFAKSLRESKAYHPPVQKGPCTLCHDPHGAAVGAVLKKKLPELCVDCHSAIGKKAAGVKVPHKPILQASSCSGCHATHYSRARGLLATDEKTLCLSCHDTDKLGNPPLKNIKKELEGKKYLHGPISKGSCTACHDPHGSDFFRMLRGGYPSELYVPYREGVYQACLNCHDKNLLGTGGDKPVGTNFRNGSRNLHAVHVVRIKGRTCRICHAPHASNGPKLLHQEGQQFGEWKIPINFKSTATGGSCAPGCHKPFSYDRQKPVAF